MLAYSTVFTSVGLILAAWLVIAFLPRILDWLKLKDRIRSEHLSLLYAALLGYTVFIAVFVPLAKLISNLPYVVMSLLRL
jgi:hypothetical protein